ncbi:Uncharacterized protein LSUE1_G003146 [Lachnellula suecica]|uniref:Amidohydrolase-related domain-containing protein n=1 Tax=Lachnellula suecica TaxID=602035 RepID=A0A8T9CEI2_9HELO|nr:Uncharacterized protein LSUE1_G003146 [Lachnellula suecica]
MLMSAGILRGMLSNGFTTVREVGGAEIAHAKATKEFLIPGPRVFQGGRLLSQMGGHGNDTCCGGSGIRPSNLGRTYNSVAEYLKATRDNIRKGAKHIKVYTSGGIASETDKLEAITTTTKNIGGTLVTAHCYTAGGVYYSIEGGVRGIEHGNIIYYFTAKFIAEKGCFLTLTLALYTFIIMLLYNKFETLERLRKNAIIGAACTKVIRYAEDAGVYIYFGTNATGPTLVMQTYEFVVRAALLLSPVVLKQATINGAKQIGMEGLLNELIPGAYADLLFLNENPLEDIICFDRKEENLVAIMKDGRFVKSHIAGVKAERECSWN